MSKEEIEKEAEALDISISGSLKRAKKKLQLKTWKEKGRVDGKWFWELPVMLATMQQDDL